jgi:predicted DNA-binding ribbon-helix-helix protein
VYRPRRSIFINGYKTSVSLENEFWNGLHEIADQENMNVPMLVEQIDRDRKTPNLSCAIRIFVFSYFRGRQKMDSVPSSFIIAEKKNSRDDSEGLFRGLEPI